jgi:CDP-glucose 4,6-dehydratase
MVNTLQTYKGKKVLVTGHTGFKGTWLITILQHIGAVVSGYALSPNHEHAIFNSIDATHYCEKSVIADIRNKQQLEDVILEFQPDYIFHLAAQPLVRLSYLMPSDTFDVNVLGTTYLLDAVRKLTKKCNVIIITTDKVYKNKELDIAYKESDELGGYDPYSASKACAELVVASYRNSFFNREKYIDHEKAIICARAGNVIGGGDYSADRIIPDLIKSLEQNQELIIRNPNAIRPWQHVMEPLIGYLKLGALMNENYLSLQNAYNFGPELNDHLNVEALVQIAIKTYKRGQYKILKQDQLHEAGILKLDISLAKKDLKWQPYYNASVAIQKTIEWYSVSDNKQLFTKKQIEDYLRLINEI